MALKPFISVVIWIAFVASPTLVSAKTSNSTTIGISIVIPEHAEDQRCTIGFENSLDKKFIAMKNSGCRYNSENLLQVAYQQATRKFKKNSQGFITVVITAP